MKKTIIGIITVLFLTSCYVNVETKEGQPMSVYNGNNVEVHRGQKIAIEQSGMGEWHIPNRPVPMKDTLIAITRNDTIVDFIEYKLVTVK